MESISFGRDKTQIIKGIALILMLFHHTGVPGFWAVDGTNLYSALAQIQNATKMCVDIFTFFIGYGFFCSNNKSLSYSFKRILLLLIPYWFMFLFMFLPCCYLSGNLPEVLVNNKHGVHWIIELIYNLFGFSSTINQYSWFVAFYICAILLLPFVHKVINKCPPHFWFILIPIYYVIQVALHSLPDWEHRPIIYILFYTANLMPLVTIGYMTAKWNKEGKLPQLLFGKFSIIIFILGILVSLFLKSLSFKTYGLPFHAIYTPVFVFSCVGILNAIRAERAKAALIHIGDLSMYMWFFHAIFYSDTVNLYTKPIVFAYNNFLYTFIVTFVITYIGSWLIKKLLTPVMNKIK